MFRLRDFSQIICLFLLLFNFSNSNCINFAEQFSNKRKFVPSLVFFAGVAGLMATELQSPNCFPWFRKYSFLNSKKREEFWKKNKQVNMARTAACSLMCAGVVCRIYTQYYSE